MVCFLTKHPPITDVRKHLFSLNRALSKVIQTNSESRQHRQSCSQPRRVQFILVACRYIRCCSLVFSCKTVYLFIYLFLIFYCTSGRLYVILCDLQSLFLCFMAPFAQSQVHSLVMFGVMKQWHCFIQSIMQRCWQLMYLELGLANWVQPEATFWDKAGSSLQQKKDV